MSTSAKFWNDIAERYAKRPVANVPAFERKQAITRQQLAPQARVLELGCGTGSLALTMARDAGHIHAIDISINMIRIAQQKQQAQGITNVTFQQGTLDEAGPFASGSFDSVWAYSILHLVADRTRTLQRLFDLLKPGGTLVSSNVCLGDSWLPYGPMISVLRWFGKAPFVYVYGRATMLRELHEAGFVEVQEHDVGAGGEVAFVVARKPGKH